MRLILLFFFVALSCLTFAQDNSGGKQKKFLSVPKDKATFEEAELLFIEGNFPQALAEYQKLEKKYPEEPILVFRIGVCYLYEVDGLEKSLQYLQRLDRAKFAKTDYSFQLGRALHLNYKFDEAKAEFENCLTNKNISPKQKEESKKLIQNCINGKILMDNPTHARVENLGPGVNTAGSEYVPVISSDESVLLFTYRGPKSIGGKQTLPGVPNENGDYFEDIYMSVKTDTGWSQPQPLPENINTNGHDACIALSNDGQKLFIFKNPPEDPGQIEMSRLDGKTWLDAELLKGQIQSNYWEGSITLSADEQSVYFSSERPGGYGGKDIYVAYKNEDGTWGRVKNLGPAINTPEDDDAPFIHPNGISLVFSSRGHNSMGGFDLFFAELKDDSTWTTPVNFGYPVNTPGDDIYFVLSADGERGYYSSSKPGGFGMQDLYVVHDPMPVKFNLVLVKGVVNFDDKPVASRVIIKNLGNGAVVNTLKSNSATGKYLINLSPGKEYEIEFRLDSSYVESRRISTLEVDSFFESVIDINFYSPEYRRMLDSLALAQKKKEEVVQKKYTMEEWLKNYGDVAMEGLEFRVQVGAYNLPKNFNYSNLLRLGKVEKLLLEDGITRFTIGRFETLKSADVLKNKVIVAGVSDAFVTAIYKGRRVYLQDILELLKD